MTTAVRQHRAVIIDDDAQRALRLRTAPVLAPLDPVTVQWGIEVEPLVRLLEPRLVIIAISGDASAAVSFVRALPRANRPAVIVLATGGAADSLSQLDGVSALTTERALGDAIARAVPDLMDQRSRGESVAPAGNVLHLGEVVVDLARGEVIRRSERTPLAPTEHALLVALAREEGRVVSRQSLLDEVWHGRATASRVVDRQVFLLRKRLEQNPRRPRHLLTVFEKGYRLVP